MSELSSDFVTLVSFPELRDALPYAEALSKEGIEHRISEQFSDFDPSFASRRKMDQVKVEVAGKDHDRAIEVVQSMDSNRPLHVVERNGKEKKTPATLFWGILTGLLLLSTLYFANKASKQDMVMSPEDPVFRYELGDDSMQAFWRATEELAAIQHDEDQNGTFEKIEFMDQEGDLVLAYIDNDQNGVSEEVREYDQLERLAHTYHDRDQNMHYEEHIEHRKDGDVKYIDANNDTYFDPDEIVPLD